MIHEVATSLTIILCHAQILELEVRKEATSQTSERLAKQCLGREQESIEMIIQQAHQIDQIMMMVDTAALPETTKDKKEG